MEIKRKTQEQLQALERFYSEDNYPTQSALEEFATTLGLTCKQIRGWFVEKRRKEKRELTLSQHTNLGKKLPIHDGANGFGLAASGKTVERDSSNHTMKTSSSSRYKCQRTVKNKISKRMQMLKCLQDLLSSDYILEKVFRKDGPPLGIEFDSLPSGAFLHHTGFQSRASKRRKVSNQEISTPTDCNKNYLAKKHGIGKGLMTVWRVTNPNGGDFPTGINFGDRDSGGASVVSTSLSQKPSLQKNRRLDVSAIRQGKVRNKLKEKRKHLMRKGEVESNKLENENELHKVKCELALDGTISQHLDYMSMLVDDEELELRELQAGVSPVTCCNHFPVDGLHGCSLCKDLLPMFPPNSVKMMQPFKMNPWDSSPQIIKKLFKVFHFLYTYAVTIDICPFTLDEFAQAFHDKDSLLLGKIHLALLKLLLCNVESELSCGLAQLSKSCKFLALIHSLENQESALEVWKRSLNPLTWTEILRQVLVAAHFGSKQDAINREAFDKEMTLMAKYGLGPGTLKGELFRNMSEHGNNGMKVSELARLTEIVELNLTSTTEELELLICSALASDITMFEKIASSAYRLRIKPAALEVDEFQSDTDSGSVDDVPANLLLCNSVDDSECDSHDSNAQRFKGQKNNSNSPNVFTEIDVSYPGEAWLLGLMEGEYSDLSIEEKLNALVALIDLLSDGFGIKLKDSTSTMVEYLPNSHHYGSGAKIKRSSTKPHNLHLRRFGHLHSVDVGCTSLERQPVDSSASISNFHEEEKSANGGKYGNEMEEFVDLHPMQSVYLGSDRRYNRYWLFLGPCNASDPGHRRVYFESSEDGQWKVINTKESLCALLSVLDDRGKREAFLIETLEMRQAFLCEAMSSGNFSYRVSGHSSHSDQSELDMVREGSMSSVSDVDNLYLTEITSNSSPSSGPIVLDVGNKGEEGKQKWYRLQAFDSWIWKSFYSDLTAVKRGKRSFLDSLARCESCHDLYWRDEKHCRICHTTFELDFDLEERYAIHKATCKEKEDDNMFPKHKVLSSKLQSLKAALHAIESVMPEGAMVGAWTKSAHKLWVKRLRRTSSLTELFQVLADFVGAINEDSLCQYNLGPSSTNTVEEIITSFASLPQTSSAIALWLVRFDALISPLVETSYSEKQQQIQCRGKQAPKK